MRVPLFIHARKFWLPLGAVAIVTAGLVMSGATPYGAPASGVTAGTPASALVAAPPAPTSYADAVSHAAPAVVTVRIERKAEAVPDAFQDDPLFQRFFGSGPGRRPNVPAPIERGLGSGVIVSTDGNILTNNHVVDHADQVQVTLVDGRELPAKVVGTDPATDLAVLHISATGLTALPLGNSDAVRVGDVVLALGNPLGVGQTVTMGIISAKNRTTDLGNGNYEDFLQTDAPINEGNSGGALITSTGELVGINSQIMSPSGGNIGIGFAIPATMARNIMNQLLASGHVRRALLGVTVQPVTSEIARSLGLPEVRGALVDAVEASGPAAKAGVEQGDVILKVNGETVNDSNQLRNHVSAMAPGAVVTLDVSRHGAMRQIKVTLGELPASGAVAARGPAAKDDLGMTVEPLTPALAQRLHVPSNTEGVAVTVVDPLGVAARAGIQAGDVVRQVDGRPVRTADAMKQAINSQGDRPALLYVQRGDAAFYIALPTHGS
jgi:Do/DeqQ family serine protease